MPVIGATGHTSIGGTGPFADSWGRRIPNPFQAARTNYSAVPKEIQGSTYWQRYNPTEKAFLQKQYAGQKQMQDLLKKSQALAGASSNLPTSTYGTQPMTPITSPVPSIPSYGTQPGTAPDWSTWLSSQPGAPVKSAQELEQEKQLDALLESIYSTPGSSRQYLTPQEFSTRFGLTTQWGQQYADWQRQMANQYQQIYGVNPLPPAQPVSGSMGALSSTPASDTGANLGAAYAKTQTSIPTYAAPSRNWSASVIPRAFGGKAYGELI